MRTLIANVYIDPDWWGPAYGNADQVPDDVAEKITNPDVWADIEPDPVEAPAPTTGPADGNRRDEIAAALDDSTTPPPASEGTVDDITALDDDALATWLSNRKADEVLAAVDQVLSAEATTVDDKATFLARVSAAEAAGKDRKGIAEQLEAIVERLTATPTTEP